MKLKQNDGKVEFLMLTGKDMVKSTMSVSDAEKIIKSGKTETCALPNGYTLCVDDKFYFVIEDENAEHLSLTPKKKNKKSTESE